jgi:hypothetical protein
MARGQDNSAKDKEMAARLKRDPQMCERFVGRCAICYALIRNGKATFNHYLAHAHGADQA